MSSEEMPSIPEVAIRTEAIPVKQDKEDPALAATEQVQVQVQDVPPPPSYPPPLRRGKWTAEESAYANRLIHEFRCGSLPLPNNVTLREFLSKTLRCDPMRITKKFEGDNSLRKVVYKRMADDGVVDMIAAEVKLLENAFLQRLEQTKASSSQAAADSALLDDFRASRAKDLVEWFCLNLNADADQPHHRHSGDDVDHSHLDAMHAAVHHPPERQSAAAPCSLLLPSLQRDLLLHLSRMQALIQRQQLGAAAVSSGDDAPPPLKRFKKADGGDAAAAAVDDAADTTADRDYHMATANLLTVQRMITDNKHKLIDLEFNLIETATTTLESNGGNTDSGWNDDQRKREVMDSIRSEIEMLEKQKCRMAEEIEAKYHRNSFKVNVGDAEMGENAGGGGGAEI